MAIFWGVPNFRIFTVLVITFDTLLIKLMKTAQLTFNGRTITEFFAVLFLFRGIPMLWKGPRPAELSAIRNLLVSFSIFLGTLWCYKWATVGPRYTAPKISAISYLFGTFSLLTMGDTERPRYTGFRGLSVCGITPLQCNQIQYSRSIVFQQQKRAW